MKQNTNISAVGRFRRRWQSTSLEVVIKGEERQAITAFFTTALIGEGTDLRLPAKLPSLAN